jgi:hypothetical protein
MFENIRTRTMFIPYITQTLTTLYLANNQISDQGAQYFADALQQNQVTFTHLTISISCLFTNSNRR